MAGGVFFHRGKQRALLESHSSRSQLSGHISVVLHTQVRHSLHLDTSKRNPSFSLQESSGFSYNRSTKVPSMLAGCTRGDRGTELTYQSSFETFRRPKFRLWCRCQPGQFNEDGRISVQKKFELTGDPFQFFSNFGPSVPDFCFPLFCDLCLIMTLSYVLTESISKIADNLSAFSTFHMSVSSM